MTQPNNHVVRCPKCGGLRLQVRNNTKSSAGRSTVENVILLGIVGLLLSKLRDKDNVPVYWECENCKYTFPAE